jgi:spore maturation protein CgeB
MKIVLLGLSVTSSWGNGHATTYRGLMRGLAARGHDVLFLERDKPWYAAHRDQPNPPYGRARLYDSLDDLRGRFSAAARAADLVVVGSYVPEGARVAEWALATARGATAFYDIDTPVTLARLESGDEEYLAAALIPRFDLYLSFTGGPTLRLLERRYGARRARVLYCSVDPDLYYRERRREIRWDLGYIGTYSADRQPALERLLIDPAARLPEARFVVAGSLFPESIEWLENVSRIEHLPPSGHRTFYNAQRFTLNLTRQDMIRAGYSPSVRLFEAAACGVPIISDCWPGLEEIFETGRDILVARDADDTLRHLRDTTEAERLRIASRARRRVMAAHTCFHRAAQLEQYAREVLDRPAPSAEGAQLRLGQVGDVV